MAEDKQINGHPKPQHVDFWADLGYTLIKEIVCSCGFKNKVEPEWHTGFYKVECGGCWEELDIHHILRAPDRTPLIDKMFEDDVDENVVIAELNKKKKSKDVVVPRIPPPIQRELDAYVKELEKMEEEKRKYREHRRRNDHHNNSEKLLYWNEAEGRYREWIREGDKKNEENKDK